MPHDGHDAHHEGELLASADAGRLADPPITPAAIRAAVQRGRLKPVAVTAGGTRLFARADVEMYLRDRGRRLRGDAA